MQKLTNSELNVIKALIKTQIDKEKDLIRTYKDVEKFQVVFVESLNELETILKKLNESEEN
jgi:inorganic pyrophosphatase